VTEPQTIETIFVEERRYPPPPEFAAQALANADVYDLDFEEFWETEGRERVTWFEPFDRLLEWELPRARWYLGGKLNVAYNCVDRHVEAGLGDRVAYHWEGEPEGDRRTISYADLQRDVVRFANALKELASARGRRSRSTWGWSRSCRPRCSPARASAHPTRSSSGASRPTPSPTGRTTWAARC
jgi:acetyl-CoA synthetase